MHHSQRNLDLPSLSPRPGAARGGHFASSPNHGPAAAPRAYRHHAAKARIEDMQARREQASDAKRRADRSIVHVASVTVAVVLGVLLWLVSDVLLLVFAGVLFAVFLRSLSEGLAAVSGLSVSASLAVVLALLVAVLGTGAWFLGGVIADQLGQLLPRLTSAWETVLQYLYRYDWGAALLNERTVGVLAPGKADWMGRIAGAFSTTLGAIAGIVIIVFIGLYLAIAPRTYRNGVMRLIPARGRRRAGEVLAALGDTLRWWLIGTAVKMMVIGVATTVGLLLLGVPLALVLGLLAAMLEFIPYVGPILASIPALLVALSDSPVTALYVAVLYLVVQSAEGYVLSPLVDQRSVLVPPALAITAQVLLGVTLGVLGVVFATPLTAVSLVLVKMLYVEDQLGESMSDTLRTAPPDEAE